ncbi:MAG TPA: hypothetical protein VFV71_08890 [Burkholderiales bacterium]|nr:hypothetical protein [Burkholderiales bacterium]
MARIWLLAAALGMAAPAAALAQGAPDIATFAFDDVSCAAWVRSFDDRLLRLQYGIWFRGFVSGYNFGNPGNQVRLDRLPDPAGLADFVDRYCRENPKASFIGAAIPLVHELREVRNPAPERKP